MTAPNELSLKKNLPPATVHYALVTDDHPGALPRVLELFSLRNITPDLVKVQKYSQTVLPERYLCIDIHVIGLSPAEQDIIRHKLAAQITVKNIREEILYIKPRVKLAS